MGSVSDQEICEYLKKLGEFQQAGDHDGMKRYCESLKPDVFEKVMGLLRQHPTIQQKEEKSQKEFERYAHGLKEMWTNLGPDVAMRYREALAKKVDDEMLTYAQLPPEDPDAGVLCAELLRHMYGTRAAADGLQREYSSTLVA